STLHLVLRLRGGGGGRQYFWHHWIDPKLVELARKYTQYKKMLRSLASSCHQLQEEEVWTQQ
ncbi:hypothetical protein Tsubulata_026575, partial [Turnera subulata]